MNLDDQKKAVIALFDEAAGWGVPALDARHLPRIAGALGIGMPEPVRVPPIVELEVSAEGTRIPVPEETMEIRETKYGRLPVCWIMAVADLTGEQMNRIAANFCRRHNVERCAVEPESALVAMSRANSRLKQGYFVAWKSGVFGLKQCKTFRRRPMLKLTSPSKKYSTFFRRKTMPQIRIPLFALEHCLGVAIDEYRKPLLGKPFFEGNPTAEQINNGSAKMTEHFRNHLRARAAIAFFSAALMDTFPNGQNELLIEWIEAHPRETSMNVRKTRVNGEDGFEVYSEADEKEAK